MIEFKELFVGCKAVVMRTEGEFDAFEAIVMRPSVTRKSAIVIRAEHADQAMKAEGAGWMHKVLAEEDNKDLIRCPLEELFKPTAEVNKFIGEFKALADERVAITKKMEALANTYSFHVAGKEHEAKVEKAKKAEAAKTEKKGKKKPAETAGAPK